MTVGLGRSYPNFEHPDEVCANCESSIEDHGEVCRHCRFPREAHEVHDCGEKYDPVPFVSCPEMAFGNEFAEYVRDE